MVQTAIVFLLRRIVTISPSKSFVLQLHLVHVDIRYKSIYIITYDCARTFILYKFHCFFWGGHSQPPHEGIRIFFFGLGPGLPCPFCSPGCKASSIFSVRRLQPQSGGCNATLTDERRARVFVGWVYIGDEILPRYIDCNKHNKPL